jgi:nicotinamide-nucleotide amidase
MRCEIISIGSELLLKKSSNSTQLVASALSYIGLKIDRLITVGDKAEEIIDVFNEALQRSNIIVAIGGLGSTPDDLTRQVISEALGIKLKFSKDAMQNVARFFSSLGRDIPDCCDSQADILEGAKMLRNKKGSCPGQLLEKDNKIIVLLPGPEKEVKYIINDSLIDILKEKFETKIRKKTTIHIVGLCEGIVAKRLKDVIETEKHLEKGELEFYFMQHTGIVDLEIICWGGNELLVDEILHKVKTEIYSIIGDYIYGEDMDTLEAVIGKLLTKQRKYLATAESCTGGMLASRVTDAPGSSIYYRHGAVTYSRKAKINILNVNPETIEKHSAVSDEVAVEMADNMKNIAGADYVISVTGYAGPTSRRDMKPGQGFIGLATPEGTIVEKFEFSGTRYEVKKKFTVAALEMLWRELKEEHN